jgi:hypothetical protein
MNDLRIDGPHVSAAFLCEKMLIERDNVASFIRVVDRFTVTVFKNLPPGVNFPSPTIQATLVISLKAGSVGAGTHPIKVVMYKPDGSVAFETASSAFLSGSEDNGVLMALPIVVNIPEEGLHWIDVSFEEILLTRVPLRVIVQTTSLPYQPPPMPPPQG